MKIVSVNIGVPRQVKWRGHMLPTSIFKVPVRGTVAVGRLGLEGDHQSDLKVHGGVNKAVYVYPSEHYPFWAQVMPGVALEPGAFGENLTTEGLLESGVSIGDRFRIGSAELIVTQPRTPCFKLGIRFNRHDIIKRLLHSGRTGFYLRVAVEGAVAAGDPVMLISRETGAATVADEVDLKITKSA
jgi:MOSC domain-containing protein YiiM